MFTENLNYEVCVNLFRVLTTKKNCDNTEFSCWDDTDTLGTAMKFKKNPNIGTLC